MTVHHVKTVQFVYHTRALVFVALCLLFSLTFGMHMALSQIRDGY